MMEQEEEDEWQQQWWTCPLEVGSQQNGGAVVNRGRSRLSKRGNALAMALVLYNESRHNILALVGKANKVHK